MYINDPRNLSQTQQHYWPSNDIGGGSGAEKFLVLLQDCYKKTLSTGLYISINFTLSAFVFRFWFWWSKILAWKIIIKMNIWLSSNLVRDTRHFYINYSKLQPLLFFIYSLAYFLYVTFNLGNFQTYTIVATFISFLPTQTPMIYDFK